MIDVRYGLIFQFSLLTKVSGLGIVSNAPGSIALTKALCFLFKFSNIDIYKSCDAWNSGIASTSVSGS